MEFKHKSILLNECIENLNIKKDGIYVDGTLGGGGHSYNILENIVLLTNFTECTYKSFVLCFSGFFINLVVPPKDLTITFYPQQISRVGILLS